MKKILSALTAIMLLTTLLLPFASATAPGKVDSISVAADGTHMDVILQLPGADAVNELYVYLDDNQLTTSGVVPYSQSGLGTSWVFVIDRHFANDTESKPVPELMKALLSNLVGENDNVAVVFTGEKIDSLGTPEEARKRIDPMPARNNDEKTFYRTIGDAVDYLSTTGADVHPRTALLIFSPGDNTNIDGLTLSQAKDKIKNSNVTAFAFALPYGSTEVKSDYPTLAQNGGFDTVRKIPELRDNSETIILNTKAAVEQWYTLSIDLTGFSGQTNGQLKIVAGGQEFTCTLSDEQIKLINDTRASMPAQQNLYTYKGFVIRDDGDVFTVTGWQDTEATSVEIPGEIFGKVVQSVDVNAFANNATLQTVGIGNGVTTLGENAFANCTALKEVYLPASITDINGNAFSGCQSVTFVVEKDSYAHTYVQSAGLAFRLNDMSADMRVEHGDLLLLSAGEDFIVLKWNSESIPEEIILYATAKGRALTSIASEAFYGYADLKAVTISEGFTAIGANAFAACANLVDIELPASLTDIDDTAFADCPNVNLVVVRDSYAHEYAMKNNLQFTITGEQKFSVGILDIVSSKDACFVVGCNSPEASGVTIAGTVAVNGLPLVSIEENAFANHAALKTLTIEEGVQTIGANAFAGCTQLKTVTLPQSITSIDESAFTDVSATFVVHQGSYAETFVQSMGYDHNVLRPDGEFTIGDFTLSSTGGKVSITSWNNSTASTLTVPAVIENHPVIGVAESAFANKTNLESVAIAEGVQSIAANAFSGCTNLIKVTLPESLTSIDDTAFTNCPGLVLITKADTYAHSFAQKASIPYGFPGDVVYGSFILSPADGGLAIRSWNRNDAKQVSIEAMVNGQKVVGIGDDAFANKTALETVIIEDGVKTIGANAFSGCTSLKNVTLPASLTTISTSAFSGCTNPDLTFTAAQGSVAHEFCTGKGYKIAGEEPAPTVDWIPYAAIGGGALLLIIIVAMLLTRRKPIRSQDYNVEGLIPSSVPDTAAFTSPVLSTEVENMSVRVRVTLTPVNGVQGEHFDHDMTEELVIGREPGPNGLKLPDREEYLRISRVHMRLFYEDGIMYAQNESRNGTSINSTRLGETACVLHERDRITMGRVDFIVTWHRV